MMVENIFWWRACISDLGQIKVIIITEDNLSAIIANWDNRCQAGKYASNNTKKMWCWNYL